MSTIWQVAESIELEGMKMYESLALGAPGKELAGVFSMLAREDRRYCGIFSEMEKNDSPGALPSLPDENTKIDDLFKKLSAGFVDNDEAMKALRDAEYGYLQALSLENRSIDYFLSLLDQIKDALLMAAIVRIIAEERRHARIIEDFIEFVRRPKVWLENAEFNHLDEY